MLRISCLKFRDDDVEAGEEFVARGKGPADLHLDFVDADAIDGRVGVVGLRDDDGGAVVRGGSPGAQVAAIFDLDRRVRVRVGCIAAAVSEDEVSRIAGVVEGRRLGGVITRIGGITAHDPLDAGGQSATVEVVRGVGVGEGSKEQVGRVCRPVGVWRTGGIDHQLQLVGNRHQMSGHSSWQTQGQTGVWVGCGRAGSGEVDQGISLTRRETG